MHPTHHFWLQRRALLQRLSALGLTAIPGVATFTGTDSAAAQTESPLTEEQAYQLGCEAFLYGYPLVYFSKYRYRLMTVGDAVMKGRLHRWGSWLHRDIPVTPDNVGAPQVDTLYSSAWLDLRQGPYVMRVPKTDGRYWSVQHADYYGSTFGLPSRRTVRGETWVALVGPDWKGSLPAGITHTFRAASTQTFNLLRMGHDGSDADRERAAATAREFTLLPLSSWVAAAAWEGETRVPFAPLDPKDDPLADFKTMQLAWQECPPPARDAVMAARWARIGLAVGAKDGFAEQPEEVRKGLARAEAAMRSKIIATTRAGIPGDITPHGWTAPKPALGVFDDGDMLYRAAVTLLGTVATPVYENIYMSMQTEPGSNTLLHGDQRYLVRYAPDQIPKVTAFWSLHVYRPTYQTVPNPINRYAIGDRTQGLQRDADGGLTIYLQSEDPGESHRSNWLPTPKGTAFFMLTREYEPLQGLGAARWPGPRVTRIS